MGPIGLRIVRSMVPDSDAYFLRDTPRRSEALALAGCFAAGGFDAVWIRDHLLVRWGWTRGAGAGARDGCSVNVAPATVTEGVVPDTRVSCAACCQPALLSKMADVAVASSWSGRELQ
jgi:alkanesulfonate monooxygenase SsuD/methylene tetrahydromethanopterin reductase-like flavin-dependent oxidoreductase (luciferase family)